MHHLEYLCQIYYRDRYFLEALIIVTDTICEFRCDALPGGMDGQPWQMRLKALGISQAAFAAAVGMTPTNLSMGLRGEWSTGVPQGLKATIIALEEMSEAQRTSWLKKASNERQKP